MARPMSCFAQAEEVLIDIEIAESRFESDGQLDDHEKVLLYPLYAQLKEISKTTVPTALHAVTCLASGEGMFSEWAERGFKESRRRRRERVERHPVARAMLQLVPTEPEEDDAA